MNDRSLSRKIMFSSLDNFLSHQHLKYIKLSTNGNRFMLVRLVSYIFFTDHYSSTGYHMLFVQ